MGKKLKKEYRVQVPFCGYFELVVEAGSKEEASDKVFGGQDNLIPSFDMSSHPDVHVEWELHEHITKGNVFYGNLCDIDITEEK